MDISSSLFSLVKYNAGLFKSEKQSKFLLSQSCDGVYIHQNSYVFGENGGCTRSVTFEFHMDETGINKVLKFNTFGASEIYWERNADAEAQSEKNRIELEQRKAKKVRIAKLVEQRERWNEVLRWFYSNKDALKEKYMRELLSIDHTLEENKPKIEKIANKIRQLDRVHQKVDDKVFYYIKKIDEMFHEQ
jgi:hypothetical protein